MKLKSKISAMFFILIFTFLLIPETPAQGIVGVVNYDLGTITNSVDHTIYGNFGRLIKQFGCTKIDSMVIAVSVDNETDIDSLDFYPANWTSFEAPVTGSIVHYDVTLNVAAAGTGTQILYTANAGIASASFRGYQGFKILTRGATAGNDATDPNSCRVTVTFWGS